MANKFKKIAVIIKTAAIIKIFTKTNNNYPKIYKQATTFKNKYK